MNIKRLAYETIPPPFEAFARGEKSGGMSPVEIEQAVQQVVNEILESKKTYGH
jgi:hypothetical protein